MATNLDTGSLLAGEVNACVVRMARLNSDCHPTGGADSGIVTAGIISITADPDVEAGQVFEPKLGCGSLGFSVKQEDRVKRYNLSGSFLYFDYEMLSLAFGSTLILGRAGGSFAGKVIGAAERLYNAAPRNGIYMEIITQKVYSDGGDCAQSSGTALPAATGHILGKVRLTPGSKAFENDVRNVSFTGYAENNNWLTNGPWNDYPGATYVANSPYLAVDYSVSEYAAILASVAAGFQSLPVGS